MVCAFRILPPLRQKRTSENIIPVVGECCKTIYHYSNIAPGPAMFEWSSRRFRERHYQVSLFTMQSTFSCHAVCLVVCLLSPPWVQYVLGFRKRNLTHERSGGTRYRGTTTFCHSHGCNTWIFFEPPWINNHDQNLCALYLSAMNRMCMPLRVRQR